MVYFAETAWERVEKVWVLPRRRVRWLKTEPNFAFARLWFLLYNIYVRVFAPSTPPKGAWLCLV